MIIQHEKINTWKDSYTAPQFLTALNINNNNIIVTSD